MAQPKSFGAFTFLQREDFIHMADQTGPESAADSETAIPMPYSVAPTFYTFTPMHISVDTKQTMPMPDVFAEPASTTAEEPSQKVPFTELPAELRNNIYGLALVSSRPLRLKIITKRAHKIKPPVSPSRIRATGNVRLLAYSPRKAITGGLLCTNHQVSLEAKAVVYAANKFIFEEDHILTRFVNQIGSSVKHICCLHLQDVEFERHGVGYIFDKFGRMKALKSVELPRLMFEWFSVDALVDSLAKLGQELGHGGDSGKGALEVRFVALTWEDGVAVWVDRMDPNEVAMRVEMLREQVRDVKFLES